MGQPEARMLRMQRGILFVNVGVIASVLVVGGPLVWAAASKSSQVDHHDGRLVEHATKLEKLEGIVQNLVVLQTSQMGLNSERTGQFERDIQRIDKELVELRLQRKP